VHRGTEYALFARTYGTVTTGSRLEQNLPRKLLHAFHVALDHYMGFIEHDYSDLRDVIMACNPATSHTAPSHPAPLAEIRELLCQPL
jgi:hypothetical protein